MGGRLRTLLLDNYDSYTYNLFQLLAQVNGVEPIVYKNDGIDLDGVRGLLASGQVHNIVISPGPGSPERPTDIGVCMDVLLHLHGTPVLGVCLGHQALAVAAGGRVVLAPEAVHGRVSELCHDGHPLLADIPSGPGNGFEVVRYHSLVVDAASLPSSVQPIAWTVGGHHAVSTASAHGPPGGVPSGHMDSATVHPSATPQSQPLPVGNGSQPRLIMALTHTSRPHWGVQFHPESICTKYGMQLLVNFHRLSCAHVRQAFEVPRGLMITPAPPGCLHAPRPWPTQEAQLLGEQQPQQPMPLGLVWEHLPAALPVRNAQATQAVFEALYAWREHTFWLDRCVGTQARMSVFL